MPRRSIFTVLMALASGLQWHYLIANTCSFMAGNALNYVLSILWVFRTRNVRNQALEFTLFSTLGLAGLIASQACMAISVELLGFHYTMAKVISVACTMILSFALRKLILFREQGLQAQPMPIVSESGRSDPLG